VIKASRGVVVLLTTAAWAADTLASAATLTNASKTENRLIMLASSSDSKSDRR
jgi:predicted amidohydrolase